MFVRIAFLLLATVAVGCSNRGAENHQDAGPDDLSAPGPPCTSSLACQMTECGENQDPTSVTGVVYDPAGNNPLYNVVVFIPNAEPQPLPQSGASCDSCSSLYTGQPITIALTDAKGQFTLKKVPDGDNIPLVVQVGKWRRQLVIPKVTPCQENKLPDKWVRLPRNSSEGDIPKIAISTGQADTLECLLVRVGIDKSEYVGGAAGGQRIHIFPGGQPGSIFSVGTPTTMPPGPSSAAGLWASEKDIMQYDMVLLSCEGMETWHTNQAVMHAYASAGGRVFASHYHYAWFNTGPYGMENLATWNAFGDDVGSVNGNIVTTFPKGMAFKEWLTNVNALIGGAGQLPITEARHNADVTMANTPSQAWITADTGMAPNATQYFSFNTPTDAPLDDAGVPTSCGRVVFSDLHVGAASRDYPGASVTKIVPDGCATGELSPQEKALEFMLFDLSSCVEPDSRAPEPPIQ